MLRYRLESDLVIQPIDTAIMAILVTDTAMAIRTGTIDRIGTMAIPRALRTTGTTATTGIEFTAIIVITATITTKISVGL
jgi:hypothetical protein